MIRGEQTFGGWIKCGEISSSTGGPGTGAAGAGTGTGIGTCTGTGTDIADECPPRVPLSVVLLSSRPVLVYTLAS